MNNLISIVIPNYNSEVHIVKTLDSVLHQTYKNFEIIIVDDRSKDSSVQIIENYIKDHDSIRIKLIYLDKNHGMPAAPRNIGVENANGEWIAFLDCDDIWHPSKLKLQMKALIDNKSSFCSAKMADFRDDSEIVFNDVSSARISSVTFRQQLLKNRVPTSSVLVKKDIALQYKFNESKEYKAREDFDCWLKIHENIKSSIKINQKLVFYRLVDNQMSGNKFKMILKNYMVLKNYKFNDGSRLGVARNYYFMTQVLLAVYYRLVKKVL